ncbi:MAG: UDP-N-acetylmuramoyl-tripeptide--D-alanyl-D-alanine ligase [Gammaproteobacteria bacterium]|nr:MAG: UDP-N-acetylmuramoyl-tripeptide--D-alanyl-D-alanine ligase [Gammaproteobacteria bacterium]TND02691.1 MAG: UDP-N-acetylmuramoyl-tripeptide--D-alanyl-D-alanine ligase [Gammaproteobacteria bacterium]
MAGGELRGGDVALHGVSIDTRTLRHGDLFVALRGPQFDGHDFIDQAQQQGAAGAMVSQASQTAMPLVRVADTRAGLGDWARAWRARFTLPVIGVTGSNGKTTVKEMLSCILGQRYRVLATTGNLNNDIGVPLTLLQLNASHQCAVIEMGANHGGEIAYLTRLAQPTIALITNAGAAHLEGFGSLDGVARGKGEIYDGLADDGIGVINADDRYAGDWRRRVGRRPIVTFAIDAASATVRALPDTIATTIDDGAVVTCFTLHSPSGVCAVRLPLAGRHNVINALAAAAAALAAGATLDDVANGLAAMRPVGGRLDLRINDAGVRVIDDTYNANPSSVTAAIDVLGSASGTRMLVIGDMAELGERAAQMHEAIGRKARAAGVEHVYATGVLSRFAAEAFGSNARHFASQPELIDALRTDLARLSGATVTILVKGSRSSRMENIVKALAGTPETALQASGGGGH